MHKNAILLDIDEYCHDAKAEHVVNCCDDYPTLRWNIAMTPRHQWSAMAPRMWWSTAAFLCISLRFSAFLCISMHFSSLHLYAFHCISLHLTAFHCISLHFSACFFIYLIFLISLICLGVCASYFKECVPHT